MNSDPLFHSEKLLILKKINLKSKLYLGPFFNSKKLSNSETHFKFEILFDSENNSLIVNLFISKTLFNSETLFYCEKLFNSETPYNSEKLFNFEILYNSEILLNSETNTI